MTSKVYIMENLGCANCASKIERKIASGAVFFLVGEVLAHFGMELPSIIVLILGYLILGLAGFASMWMAVFADTGVAMLCVLNSIRILYKKS